jgi:hypothetical protein
VELANGQVVRCETPSRAHQAAAARVTAMLDAAAEAHMERNPGTCLDTNSDFDVLLWEVPAATIRSSDATLFDGVPVQPGGLRMCFDRPLDSRVRRDREPRVRHALS